MNKTFYIFLLFLLFCCEAKTQTEYITNGSFEQIDSCNGCIANLGFDIFEWSGCKGWSNPIYSSSDLWCRNGLICNLHPPYVGIGYQNTHSGENMAGFFVGDAIVLNYREYIQNELSYNLIYHKRYKIEMFVSSRNGECSISEIGVKFFSQKYYDQNIMWLTNFKADAVNDPNNFITDSAGWQKLTMYYEAKGQEKFVVIGCFVDSLDIKYLITNCDTTFWNGGNYASDYIFIDDVSIIEVPFEDPEIPNIITVNGDGINDFWKIDFKSYKSIVCTVYDRWGLKVYEVFDTNVSWDGHDTHGNILNDASYFYTIQGTDQYQKEKYFKGVIQLVR